jgi:predicted  nucleic acid-binding Zn-ribbon protein
MARVLTIFSILIGLATAFLGWKTKEQAQVLQDNLTAAKSARATAETKQKAAEKSLDETKTKLEETEGTLKKAQDDLTNTKGELQNIRADYEKAKADVEEKAKRIAEVEEALKTLPKGVNPEQMGAQIKELNEAKTRLETELAEAKQVQETLRAKAEEAEGKVASQEQTIQSYRGPIVRQGLTGKVLAYNPGWNFVVLNIGDKSGLRNGVQLVVTRNGAMVGKVRVTTVEPSTAIADVLPGSLAKGESVQPGDSVVFQGRVR